MKEKDYTKEELEFIREHRIHAYIRAYGKEHIYKEGAMLEDVVYELERLRRNGQIYVYAIFNGVYLYSFDETYDSAFRKVYKVSRRTWLDNLAKERRREAVMKIQEEQEHVRKLKLK